ncbi:MAG: DNA adenine methylase [Candidatus Thorarchaeota archaeon]
MTFKRSIISWYGGKWYLLGDILPFPKHTLYAELFCGSIVVLINKIKSDIEVINDNNNRLINLWNIVKNKWYELKFISEFKGDLDSRSLFEKYKEESEDSLEDAFRFFYVNHHSFSHMGKTYHGIDTTGERNLHLTYLNQIERIKEIYDRIKHIFVENQDFKILLKRMDKKNALLYLDPPYFDGGEEYEKIIGGKKWEYKDYEILRKKLDEIENCKFVLSIDNKDFFDNPNWFIQEVERWNFASSVKTSKSIEYIIRNFDNDRVDKMKLYKQKEMF